MPSSPDASSTATPFLSPAARSVWAKSGHDPESTHWLPLWLHLLDTGAVARHLALNWYGPTVPDVLQREFKDSTTGLTPLEEFAALAAWMGAVHDIGKATPAFAQQVPRLFDRMQEAGLRSAPIDRNERREAPHAVAGQVALSNWLITQHGWTRRGVRALASVVGSHHGLPPTLAKVNELINGLRPGLFGAEPWEDARSALIDFVTTRTGVSSLLPDWRGRGWSQPFLVALSGLVIVADRTHLSTSLYILSPQVPNCSQIEQEAGVVGSMARTLDYRPFLDRLDNGQEWNFRLAANPARAIAQGAGKRGKVAGHVTVAQQQEWLTSRAQRNGFELLSMPGVEPDSNDAAVSVVHREKPVFRRAREDGRRDIITINRTVFEGSLRVTDVDEFRAVLVKGLGRSKAYGCGLLTLAKASRN